MIVAHIMGIPVEENVLQFAPAGATAVTMIVVAGRGRVGRVITRIRRRVATLKTILIVRQPSA